MEERESIEREEADWSGWESLRLGREGLGVGAGWTGGQSLLFCRHQGWE